MSVNPINISGNSIFSKGSTIATKGTSDGAFGDLLKSALKEVNSLQGTAEQYNEKLAIGEIDNIHQVMVASEKANLALQLTLSVRNKIVDAYKEIMRMQI